MYLGIWLLSTIVGLLFMMYYPLLFCALLSSFPLKKYVLLFEISLFIYVYKYSA